MKKHDLAKHIKPILSTDIMIRKQHLTLEKILSVLPIQSYTISTE